MFEKRFHHNLHFFQLFYKCSKDVSSQTHLLELLCPPHWGVDILFLLFPPSGVRRPTWFPDILGNSSYPIFTKFGMQVYWVNSLYGIAFGDDSSIAN